MSRRNLVTQQRAAAYIGVTDRTIRNLISRGELTGYRIAGVRAVRVDMNELDALVKAIPALSRRAYKPFGPRARIVNVVEAVRADTVGAAEGGGE